MKNERPFRWTTAIQLAACLGFFGLAACQGPPVKINLISDRTFYRPQEPIKIQVRVLNDNVGIFGQKKPLIVRQGFFYQDFHLRLTIVDPQGVPVPRRYPGAVAEPAPPYREGNDYLVPVEIIPPDGQNIYVMNDARKYYFFGDTRGWYLAQVRAPLQTFCRYRTGPDGERFGVLSAWGSRSYNPLASNKIRFEIAAREPPLQAAIRVHVTLSKKSAAAGRKPQLPAPHDAEVRLYRVSELARRFRPPNPRLYAAVWKTGRPRKSALTDSKGMAVFSSIERADYLVLARHPASSEAAPAGCLVKQNDARWKANGAIACFLKLAVK